MPFKMTGKYSVSLRLVAYSCSLFILLLSNMLTTNVQAAAGCFAFEKKLEEIEQDNAVYETALDIANWVDRFIGTQEGLESASYDYLRMINQVSWLEGEKVEYRPKLRAKVHLPRINKRFSLLFDDESGLTDNENTPGFDPVLANGERNGTAAINYESKLYERSKFDTRVGLDSHLKTFAMIKHSFNVYERPDLSIRNFNYLFWRDEKGFGGNLKLELDKKIDDTLLFRWGYSILRAEKSDGNEWSNTFSIVKLLGGESLTSYNLEAWGATADPYLVESYRIAVRYRRQMSIKWLYFEVEPEILWRRTPESIERERVPGITLRLEIQFER